MTITGAPAAIPHAPPGRRSRWRFATPWLSLVGRIALAAVFAYAALAKITDPAATVRAVRAYQLLPEGLAVPVAHALPAVELTLAALLLVGFAIRTAAIGAAVLLTAFITGVASAAARGLRIDCGCFGGGGPTANPHYTGELIRDGLLLAIAITVAVLSRSSFAIDPQPPAQTHAMPRPDDLSSKDKRRLRMEQNRRQSEITRIRRRRRWHTAAGSALLTITAVAGITSASGSTPSGPVPAPSGVTASGGILVGSPTAAHHLVIFEDPQCPVCEQFESISGVVVQRSVAAGTVQVEYRMRSFLGPESVRAVAALAAASNAGKFEALREAMYARQPREHTGGYTIDDLLALGRSVGLTDPTYQRATREQTYAKWAHVVDDRASRDGNVGTPELRLDGKTVPPTIEFDPQQLTELLGLR